MFMRPMRTLVSSHLICLFVSLTFVAQADIQRPSERVILSISGLIEETNMLGSPDPVVEFDMAMLQELPSQHITTYTSWTNGTPVFKGVLLTDLLDKVKAQGQKIRVTALNMYSADIDVKTLEQFPIILAYAMDGEAMSIRDKGPLWVIYPVKEFPELDQPKHVSSMVWQVNSIVVF
ncbi:molybdopterin-dependent oxidoreductase [Neptunomonas phycophila]|uniref:Molybdopterin-dependent oxidoreductase n=2 Tax=Neptunomonas phycophila TaxID=1572645 RepID=A0AAW7XKV3_9GAMM|nr:molybdopterin-dependent oxidoreductase [Neptunomonas phycophila]MBT3144613.1 molybdopterin-dependent oxidoreductase [Neptunomonas phycophila]MDO6453699.1 molybdopterin-dependent oxidoreductase [Neptunomonas phycophila]MDO6784036.1 molybdopterin-dependent oxidoreductase [Neptunomonas phycophila]